MVKNVQFHITAALIPQKELPATVEKGAGCVRIVWTHEVSFGPAENVSSTEITVPLIGPHIRGKRFGSYVSELKLYLCLIKQQTPMRVRKSSCCFPYCATASCGSGPPQYRGFTITLGHTTADRTSLDELSGQRRDLYLTTHNDHNKQISTPPEEFKPAIAVSEGSQGH
jgi:hypothetical protein